MRRVLKGSLVLACILMAGCGTTADTTVADTTVNTETEASRTPTSAPTPTMAATPTAAGSEASNNNSDSDAISIKPAEYTPISSSKLTLTTTDLDFSMDMPSIKLVNYGDFCVDGNKIDCIEYSLENLLKSGWETDIDTSQILKSCVCSDEFQIRWKNDPSLLTAKIRVTNTHEKNRALKDCFVASIKISSESELVSDGKKLACGTTTISDVKKEYNNNSIISETTDSIKLRTNCLRMQPISALDDAVLIKNSSDVEMEYLFSAEGLYEMDIISPNLLYGGIYDNLSESERSNLQIGSNAFYGVAVKKNELINELSDQFKAKGIDVKVDEGTGELSLPSGILFNTDKYELEESGKQYIDKIMGIYMECVLDEKYADIISGVAIDGHTDTSGDYDYNLKLSQKRADAVLDYALESKDSGVSDELKGKFKNIVKATGRSYDEPVYNSSGDVDMDASRRVTIKFMIKL